MVQEVMVLESHREEVAAVKLDEEGILELKQSGIERRRHKNV
jgi:hypothetical protein